ncbi:hypothetical protein [Amycolatopsis sp. cmx-8-4]|uniref:hypothetical protein n=1 Tax=Amycolatopsis sp. cmx-8-4 TaxID=2790947 RepID=UPI00397AAE89
MVADPATLQTMLSDHWKDSEVDTRNNISTIHAKTVATLRAANGFKAWWVSVGLIVQVAALLALSTAVALIVATD